MKIAKKFLERNIFLCFGLALALIVVLCAALYYTTARFLETNRWVKHTHHVIEKTIEIDSALKDVESGTRGYIITGDENFLALSVQSSEQTNALFVEIRRLTADNPRQQQRLDRLEPLIAAKLDFSAGAVEMRRRGDTAAAQLINSGKIKTDTDAVRALVGELKREENDLLRKRSENMFASQRNALLTLAVFGSLILVFFSIAFLAVRRDIEKRRAAGQELRKREGLYRTLVRSIPKTAVVLFDSNMRYTLADGAQLEASGFSRSTFEGKTLREVFPPEVCEKWSEYYLRALAGENIAFQQEDDGKHFLTQVLPVRKDDDEIFAGMVMWQDVTHRKQIENTLRESEHRYRDLVEKSLGLICSHDLDGVLLSVNPAAANALGYAPEEMVGKSLAEFLPPESKAVFEKYLTQIEKIGESSN
ncbi:MAG: CHASE3 domain-containing protein, partial [Acidobacteria bacterium]|nr:CHASE3 domain-containing protein [Acidobacteriota bacterium]